MGWRANLWIAVAAGLLLACALRFAGGSPLQTNLLALLPPTERNPAAERAVNALGEAAGNRAVFLVGHPRGADAAAAARAFAASLQASGAFRSVQADVPPIDPRQLARPYLAHRFGLLGGADRDALREGRGSLDARLQRTLFAPFRAGMARDAAADPFGFLDAWLAELPYRSLRLEPHDGLLLVRTGQGEAARTHVLVSAELPGSAYDGEVQRRVLRSVEAAERALRLALPGAELLRTGAVFFAGAARAQAQWEVDLIGLGSLAGITLLLLAVFRSLRPLLLGLLSVGIGLVAATAVTLFVHGELHLITLVFGASLIGEAIDYSIQYFAAHVAAGTAWDPRQGLGSVRPALGLALTTSALGYAALLLVPFPAVSQIALFALTGLVAAYVSVVLLLPGLLRAPYRHDIAALTAPGARLLAWWRRAISRRAGAAFAVTVLLLCAPGWLRLQGDDDVRLLIERPADLQRQEATIRELTGLGNGSQFYLVEGADAEEVLQREEALAARLGVLARRGTLSHFQAVSSFVPSAARQRENRALLAGLGLDDAAVLVPLFDRYGFRESVAPALARDFREGGPLLPDSWLAAPVSTPLRHLWLGRGESGYASVVLPFGFSELAPLAAAADGLAGVTLVDKAGSVSRLFQRYRQWGAIGLGLAALLFFAALARRYGAAGAAATLLPPLLGMGIALAFLGYAGIPVTLFNVMGLMLVLGVGVNYAIFLRQAQCARDGEGVTVIAVLVSAATTLLSFGLLAFSSTPALSHFGATLLTGIGAAVLLAPLALTLAGQRSAPCG